MGSSIFVKVRCRSHGRSLSSVSGQALTNGPLTQSKDSQEKARRLANGGQPPRFFQASRLRSEESREVTA